MEHTEYVDLGRFETYIHYHFKDKHLLLEALSHSSYANEKRKTRKCNERLNSWETACRPSWFRVPVSQVSGTAGGRADQAPGIYGL